MENRAIGRTDRTLALDQLLPSKKVPDGVMTTRKFKQIVASIREIGSIEPLSVIRPLEGADGFLLLDGNLRVLALKELEQDTAPCLIVKDFETYTYNHRINRLSSVQEHYMLRRVIDKGVVANGWPAPSTSISPPSTAGTTCCTGFVPRRSSCCRTISSHPM